jgi:hypothetical protein
VKRGLRARCWGLGAAAALIASPLYAQPSMPGRFELGGGVLWAGRANVGDEDASETASNGSRFRLFSSSQSFASAVGIETRFGVRLTPTLQLEANASFSKPQLEARLTSDVEGIPDVTATQSVTQWTIGGAVSADLGRWRIGRSGVPFVSAGGGYVGQLYEGETLVETGGIYHVGGGVNFLLTRTDARRLKGVGLRVDARAVVRTGGVTIDDRLRVAPILGASLFVRF